MLVADWHAALNRLRLEFDVKLSFWRLLPYRLCAVNTPQLDIARIVMRDCQNQWNGLTASQKRVAHPMTRRFLDPAWAGTRSASLPWLS